MLAKGFEVGLNPFDKHKILSPYFNKGQLLFLVDQKIHNPVYNSKPYYVVGRIERLTSSHIQINSHPLLEDREDYILSFTLDKIVATYELPK